MLYLNTIYPLLKPLLKNAHQLNAFNVYLHHGFNFIKREYSVCLVGFAR